MSKSIRPYLECALLLWRLEGCDDALTFANGEDLIGFDLREAFDLLRGWPFDFDPIHDFRFAEAEVQAKIAL